MPVSRDIIIGHLEWNQFLLWNFGVNSCLSISVIAQPSVVTTETFLLQAMMWDRDSLAQVQGNTLNVHMQM